MPDSPALPSTTPLAALEAPPTERRFTGRFGAREFAYRSRVGFLPLHEHPVKDGEQQDAVLRGQLFFMAYEAELPEGSAPRPLCFVFNGGPGSSSVWLHLGLMGPQRVAVDAMGRCGAPPYALEHNPESMLSHADLVFIDPIGTGLSRMQPGQKAAEYHGFQRDLDALSAFIHRYLTRFGRWGSAKYLVGESYGSTRAAALAQQLQTKHDLHLNGVVLISTALDFQLFRFDHANDLPYALFLPGYAATAWYHQALSPALQALPLAELLTEVEDFALGPYASALLQGDRLDGATRARTVRKLAAYSGLKSEFVERCDLRVSDQRFFKELLRERGQTVGRLDSRFTGQDRDDAGEHAEDDPSYQQMVGAFRVGIERLLHEQLGWQDDSPGPYQVLAPLYQTWRWPEHENRYLGVGAQLRQALHADPSLRVYVASGVYDLATPHAAGDFSVAHLGLRAGLRERVRVSRFEAGHMMYLHAPSRLRLADELRQFVGG
jgi:carboxypeptidase C (cathepsin A)